MRRLDALAADLNHHGNGVVTTIESKRALFAEAQVHAKVAFFDGDAILAQTSNGGLVRVEITDAECFSMAMALLERCRR